MQFFTYKLLNFYLTIIRVLEKMSQFSFTEETTQCVVWRICLFKHEESAFVFFLVILSIHLVFDQ